MDEEEINYLWFDWDKKTKEQKDEWKFAAKFFGSTLLIVIIGYLIWIAIVGSDSGSIGAFFGRLLGEYE